ncbi:MAG: 4-(cytidine 5'-diphospho)-2-C-methyl-D-erythritol kinase [Pseudomonadota bacterium]
MDPFIETAPAKINLTLSVIGRQPDGFHDLESLVVFTPDICDRLSFQPTDTPLELKVNGPFATATPTDDSNLVLQAIKQLSAHSGKTPKGRLTLEKNLPVEAGIGGGSSDAAAGLRLFSRFCDIKDEDLLMRIAGRLGSDIPVCLRAAPGFMRGRGERITPLSGHAEIPVILVNPLIPLSTAGVFGCFDAVFSPEINGTPAPFQTLEDFYTWLEQHDNDLTCAATALCPEITDILSQLHLIQGCKLARMSGSGATCLGLFDTPLTAKHAAQEIKAAHPDWWVQHGHIKAPCL